MGFHATDTLVRRPQTLPGRSRLSSNRRQAATATPSKNRVWDFFATFSTSVWKFVTQPVEPHQETFASSTIIVSDVRYYGNRFYIPALGRWISKDPSGEHGGHNLYAFVANNAISSRDALGLMRSLPEPTLDGPSETADDDDFYWWLDHSSNPNGDSWIGGAMALAEGAPGRILVTHHWANCSGDRQKVVVDVPSNNAKYSSRIKPGLSGIIVRPGGTRTIAQHERRHFDIARLHDRSYTKPVYLLEGRCVCKECVPVLKNYIYWYQAAADDLQEYADAQQEVDDYPNGVKRNGNIPIANAAAAALDVDIAHLNDAIGEMPSKCDNCADVRGLPGRR